MVDVFPQLPLGKIVAAIIDNRGKTPPWGENELIELIETASIVGDNKYPDYSLVQKRISKETYDNWFRGHPRAKDILIATVGANIGNLSIMKESRGCVAQNLVCLRVDTKQADPDFVYYFLTWEPTQIKLKNLDIGAAQPSIKVPHLLNTKISLPPLSEQREIAGILGTLDDKIEVNRRMNATLESIARKVFRQWFVDYPQAKWEVKPFGGIIEFVKGKKPDTTVNEPIAGFLPLILIEMLDTGNSPYAQPEKMVVAEQNNVLMVMDGASSGRVEIGHHGIVGSTIAKILSKENSLGDYFLYYSLKEKEAEARENLTGTSIPHMDKQWLFRQTTCLPDQNKMREFEEFAENIQKKIQANLKESRTLASLRDSLLPKLMRGELRVRDVEILQ